MNEQKIELCVIFGGMSSEYSVSLMTAYSVIKNADPERYNITMLGITDDGYWMQYDGSPEKILDNTWLYDMDNLYSAYILPERGSYTIKRRDGGIIPIDVVFPAVHGEYAEDGKLQGLLEMTGIPFVGSGTRASAVAMDKATTKAVISLTDVPQAKFVLVTKASMSDFEMVASKVEKELGYPMFVKPSSAGSSVGVSKVRDGSELRAAIEKAMVTDPSRVLVEEYIDGREIEVAVLGNDEHTVSVCGEIDPGAEFYDYETKYKSDSASYYIPARLDSEVSEKVREYADTVYTAVGAHELARVDFFVKKDGSIIFNEINTLPGFTSISMYPKLMMESGMSYSKLIDTLVDLALEDSRK